jgi:Zn-dependent protease with chaperone function
MGGHRRLQGSERHRQTLVTPETAASHVRLVGLRPQSYEHPSDRRTLDALHTQSGLESVIRKFNEFGIDRLLRVQLMGSYLRATEDCFPELYNAVQRGCDVLDLPKRPAVYIQPGGLNAFTAGVEQPIVVFNAGLIDSLTAEEMAFVVGHELGHIKSGHILYYQLAMLLPVLAEVVGAATLGIGSLLSFPLEVALIRWQRMSELTADRAGLLACQDVNAATTALMKLAGLPSKFFDKLNTEDFVAQAREFESFDSDKLDWMAKILSGLGQSHPWTVMRASELLHWIDSSAYEQILANPTDVKAIEAPKSFCTQCGTPAAGAFCSSCGARLVT